jgi:hypothetical protein
LKVALATSDEQQSHEAFLARIEEQSGAPAVWHTRANPAVAPEAE